MCLYHFLKQIPFLPAGPELAIPFWSERVGMFRNTWNQALTGVPVSTLPNLS